MNARAFSACNVEAKLKSWFKFSEFPRSKRSEEAEWNVVYIDTGRDNVRAIRLYENMGFREFGRTIHFKKIIR